MKKKKFEGLELKKKMLNLPRSNAYNVYENDSKFVRVEAETVEEAMQKCEIKNPIRIQKINIDQISFVEPSMVVDTPAPETESKENPEAPKENPEENKS